MASPSARKIRSLDGPLIKQVVREQMELAKSSGAKLWFKHLEYKTVVDFLFSHEHVYIVDEAYLVAYDLGSPWYTTSLFLQELVVLRLVKGSSFDKVTSFLEERKAVHGAVMIGAGTALAREDAAVAALYEAQGFRVETLVLTKE